MVQQENLLNGNRTTVVGGEEQEDDDEEEPRRRSTFTSTSILNEMQYRDDNINDNNNNTDNNNNSNNNTTTNNTYVNQEHNTGRQQPRRPMTSFQLLEEQEQEQEQKQQQQQSDYGDNCDRFHKIKFKILRTKYCNHLAYKYYSKRQLYVSYLPLQLFAMVISIVGFLGAGKGSNKECNDESSGDINGLSLLEGILGTIMVFLISLSKNLNYDAKAKQHELVASQMKSLIDNLDVLEYTVLIQGKNDNNNDNNDYSADGNITSTTDDGSADGMIIQKGFEKVESDFFSSAHTLQTVLPCKIGLAYNKLQFELQLLRINTQSVYHNDDPMYYRVVQFAYAELAVILGSRILYLPPPEVSVKMTLERVNALLITPS